MAFGPVSRTLGHVDPMKMRLVFGNKIKVRVGSVGTYREHVNMALENFPGIVFLFLILLVPHGCSADTT